MYGKYSELPKDIQEFIYESNWIERIELTRWYYENEPHRPSFVSDTTIEVLICLI